ncbi:MULTISPECIES: hypothetical protein [Pirellulaceae]|uniref:hypothetical protein n=1 Tax=Pirellulaceae TaxID=2691357 RepID=UPI0011B0D2B9|nr:MULTISPECIES: hypothetical protein [Pirellulaceae]
MLKSEKLGDLSDWYRKATFNSSLSTADQNILDEGFLNWRQEDPEIIKAWLDSWHGRFDAASMLSSLSYGYDYYGCNHTRCENPNITPSGKETGRRVTAYISATSDDGHSQRCSGSLDTTETFVANGDYVA